MQCAYVPGIGIGGGYIRYSTPPSRHGFYVASFSRAGHTPIQESAHPGVLGLTGRSIFRKKLSIPASRVLDPDPDSIALVDPDPESQSPTIMFLKEAYRILLKPGSSSCRST